MSSVLIVDDSSADRALFRRNLGREGFQVHELARGLEAVDRVRELRPQVVVLDVNLPDTDGHEVCRALRADPDCAGVPVLMLTVRDRADDVLAGLEAGADDYVAKDEAPEVIVARLRRLIRYRQMANSASLNEQLAQVGRLLAGIVHEIRGPLAVIRGHVDLIRLQFGDDERAAGLLGPIQRNVQLLQLRLEHLMAAVRGGPPACRPMDLPPLVAEAVALFATGSGPERPKVQLVPTFEPGLPAVLADEGRLMLVLLNLFNNAREAILAARPGGRIVIRAEHADRDGRAWVRLAVADDGPGIAPSHLGRLFEPFFTTKPGGSGFGLYLSAEVLREQGGRIEASNGPDGGACFTVWLPAVPAAAGRPLEGVEAGAS